jgi:CubicO group peptidase (beta-lactamase class C family)
LPAAPAANRDRHRQTAWQKIDRRCCELHNDRKTPRGEALVPRQPIRLPVLTICFCVAFATGIAGAAESLEPGDRFAAIAGRMQNAVDESQISGAVTLVAHQGATVHLTAVGQADIENQRPMRTDTVFAIASMTKPITATAVMILQDEGRLSVNDPVSKYIPQFKHVQLDGRPPPREITIRDLLTHTSGVGGSQRNQGTLKETVELLAENDFRADDTANGIR